MIGNAVPPYFDMGFFEKLELLGNLFPVFVLYFFMSFLIFGGVLLWLATTNSFYSDKWKVLLGLFVVGLIISIIPYGISSLFSSDNELIFNRAVATTVNKFYASFWGVVLAYISALVAV